MAQLPGRRALHLSAVLVAALVAAGPAGAVDLEGTWHVLVHYTDANSSSPEQMRWQDRIWVFEHKGSKLRWTEYPIVVFANEEGRFERRASGQYARVLGAWEPSPVQLENIKSGLRINTRGSRQKSLRGSDEDGWHSTARARATSASVITYQENWSIEGAGKLPVFRQDDVMSSLRAEELEGVTLYETTGVEEDGNVLVGRFDRDGSRKGTFRMTRSGEVGTLDEKTQSELQAQAFERSAGSSQEASRAQAESAEEPRQPQGPDDSVRYGLPFRSDVPRRLYIGYRGSSAFSGVGSGTARTVRSDEKERYRIEFAVPKGTELIAARGGRVTRNQGVITIAHEDGTYALYGPVVEGDVKVDQRVERGDHLGVTGGQHGGGTQQMMFGVYQTDESGNDRSLRVRFDDGTPDGFEPVQGAYYGGEGEPGKTPD